jgi:hypothetical protein
MAVEPQTVSIDIETLSIEEVEIIEDMLGLPIDKLTDPNTPKGRMMRAIAYVIARRTDPTVTPEDVGKWTIRLESGTLDPTGASGR